MGGLVERFVQKVRRIVGLPDDPGKPPSLMNMALCWAKVIAQNSDGTVDLQPADARYSGEKNVSLAAPFPNTQVKMQAGALVILAWAYGDPAQKFALPIWGAGATLTSASIGSSPDAVATKRDLQNLLYAIHQAVTAVDNSGATFKANLITQLGLAGWTASTGYEIPPKCGSGVVGVQR